MRRTARLYGLLLLALGLMAALAAAAATAATTPGVDPATWSPASVALPGQSFDVTKTVHTATIPPKPDVVFLADTTASMAGAIGNVQTNASGVMSAVAAAQPDAQFGSASYKDFDNSGCGPDPYVYRLEQPVTPDTTLVQAGIGSWSAYGGCDTPESYIYALYQLATDPATAWRDGSSRIVAWFGDSPSHDPSGGITLAQAIAALQAADVRVIAVNTGWGGLDEYGQATAITSATGGVLLSTGDDVSGTILAGLHDLPVTVTGQPSCDAPLSVTFTPDSQTVTSGDDAVFTEHVAVAADAPGGTYTCTVKFLANGVEGGPAFTQTITVPVNTPPDCSAVAASAPILWSPNHKLVDETLAGASDEDGDALTYTIASIMQDEPTNTTGDGTTIPDATYSGSGPAFQVRAERSGLGDGRFYVVAGTVSDGHVQCSFTTNVVVPHDSSHTPVLSSPLFDSLH